MKEIDKYVVMFSSVWSDLLVLHNYCVIISECQKVTFLGVEVKQNVKKFGEKKKLLDIS